MKMRVLTLFARQVRWAFCKICGCRTDQYEVASRKEVWECESCHHLLNHRGEPVAN